MLFKWFCYCRRLVGRKSIHLKSRYIPSNISLYDVFEEKWINTGNEDVNITIKLCFDSFTGRIAPSGRIIYLQ